MLAAIMRHRGAAFSCRCEAATSPANHALHMGAFGMIVPTSNAVAVSEEPCFFGGSCRIASLALHFGSHHGATHRHPMVLARISADLAMKLTRIRSRQWFWMRVQPLASEREGLLGNPLWSASCSTPLAAKINSADLKKYGPGGAWGGQLRPASTPSLIWGKCSGG